MTAQERGHSGRRTKGRIGRERSVVESAASSRAQRRPEYQRSRAGTMRSVVESEASSRAKRRPEYQRSRAGTIYLTLPRWYNMICSPAFFPSRTETRPMIYAYEEDDRLICNFCNFRRQVDTGEKSGYNFIIMRK